MEWEQAADRLREAIASGALASGDALPSVPELARLQGLKPGTLRHAFLVLEADGLLVIRHGRTTQVAGDRPEISDPAARYRSARSRPGHDCTLSGCRPHACKPISRSTIHTIHSILSGAFEAAQRWEWVDHNPAESAKPPAVRQKKRTATPPSAVVKMIEHARSGGQNAIALYVWLVAITGVRRGELCAVQIRDIDLDAAVLHVAYNYVVKGGKKVRKDTKTHQDRYLAIDPVTCTLVQGHIAAAEATYVISLLSEDYPQRIWTKFESRQFRSRFGVESVIPVWIDDSPTVFDQAGNVGGYFIKTEKPIEPQLDYLTDLLKKKIAEYRVLPAIATGQFYCRQCRLVHPVAILAEGRVGLCIDCAEKWKVL